MSDQEVTITPPVPPSIEVRTPGAPGKSAYDLAVQEGFVGSLQDWLDSLQGAPGAGAWGNIAGDILDQTDLQKQFGSMVSGQGSYFFKNEASDLGGGRLAMAKGIPSGGGAGISFTGVSNGTYLSAFCSEEGFPTVTNIPSGVFKFNIQARKTAGTKSAKIYAEFYTRTVLGVDTLIGTSSKSDDLTGSNIECVGFIPTSVINGIGLTDRLLIKFKAYVYGSGTDPDITLDIQGNNFSRMTAPEDYAKYFGDFTPEDVSNKAIDFSTVNDTLYPSVQAVQDELDLKLALSSAPIIAPNNQTGGFQYFNINPQVEALQNSPNETWNFFQYTVNIDPNSTGFNLGTAGTFGSIFNIGFNHDGTSDIGNASYFNTYSELGNGTDPITVKGLQFWLGFGNIAADVTIQDSFQGFGMQWNVDADAVMNGYFSGFYDNMNFELFRFTRPIINLSLLFYINRLSFFFIFRIFRFFLWRCFWHINQIQHVLHCLMF